MKTRLLLFLFALAALASGQAGELIVEPVKLTASPAINWEQRNQETVDAKSIREPVSIFLQDCQGVVISSCELHSIHVAGCQDVTIRNCWIHDSERIAVEVASSRHVVIEGCRIENVVSGIYAVDSQGVQVLGNFVRNVKGPFPRGQLAQFDNVTGADNGIRDNYAINERGKSHPEDVINIYQSAGTEASPILVEHNYLTGDPVAGSEGKSANGSGIMLGDRGGEHILCRQNVVIAAGQVGIGVAGGHFIRVEENLVFGKRSNVSRNGLYVWNQSEQPSDHVTVTRNRVNWVNKDGEQDSWWSGGGVTELKEASNQFADKTLAGALPAPPSQAPMPPKPWTDGERRRSDGRASAVAGAVKGATGPIPKERGRPAIEDPGWRDALAPWQRRVFAGVCRPGAACWRAQLFSLMRSPLLVLTLGLACATSQIHAAGSLLVTNKGDTSLSIVDPATNKQVAVIPEDGTTGHELVATADGKYAIVPIYGSGGVGKPGTDGQLIQFIDLAGRKIVKTIDLGKGVRPHCAIRNDATGLIYVTTELEQSIAIIDPVKQEVIGSVTTGQPESHMLAVTKDGKRGYTANVAPGTVSVIDLENKKLLKVIPIATHTQRISLSVDDKLAFTSDQVKPQLAVIDTATNEVKAMVPLPDYGYGTAPTPDGKSLVICIPNLNEVDVLDLATMKIVKTFSVPRAPQETLVRPDGEVAYVSCDASAKVAAINLKEGKVELIDVGKTADGLAWAESK